MTDELRDMVVRNASTEELREVARRGGMVTLRDAGMVSIHEGLTTADEVIRETILEAERPTNFIHRTNRGGKFSTCP